MSNAEVVESANELARTFYRSMGYQVPKGYKFHEASHPQELGCWNLAVIAFEHVDGTDVQNALDELDEAD